MPNLDDNEPEVVWGKAVWPETPCKSCGKPTTDEGGYCSDICLTRGELKEYCGFKYYGEAIPTNRSFAEETLARSAEDKFLDDVQELAEFHDRYLDQQMRLRLYAGVVSIVNLLDQIAPDFVEFVQEYHLNSTVHRLKKKVDVRDPECHMCQKLAKVEEYLKTRKDGSCQ